MYTLYYYTDPNRFASRLRDSAAELKVTHANIIDHNLHSSAV